MRFAKIFDRIKLFNIMMNSTCLMNKMNFIKTSLHNKSFTVMKGILTLQKENKDAKNNNIPPLYFHIIRNYCTQIYIICSEFIMII